jgi:hypothetical protein
MVGYGQGKRLLIAPRGTTVVGIARSSKRREEVGLVIIEGDGRTLSFIGRNWNRRLTSAPARIEHAVMSPAAATLAYSTVAAKSSCTPGPRRFVYRLLREDG